MAVVQVIETTDKRGGTIAMGGNRYERTFVVEFDTMSRDQVLLACFATDPDTGLTIPTIGDAFEGAGWTMIDQAAICHSIQPKAREESGYVFDVVAEYQTYGTGPKGFEEDPFKRAPEVHWSFVDVQEPYEKDVNDVATLNSAGTQFDPLPTRHGGYLILTLTRNEKTHSILTDLLYRHKTNTRWWPILGYGVNTGMALCLAITSRSTQDSGKLFWIVTYRFGLKLSWEDEVLDRGYMVLTDGPDGMPIQVNATEDDALNATGVVREKVLLDGAGNKLLPDAQGQFTPVFLAFQPYKKMDFNGLGLPPFWPPP